MKGLTRKRMVLLQSLSMLALISNESCLAYNLPSALQQQSRGYRINNHKGFRTELLSSPSSLHYKTSPFEAAAPADAYYPATPTTTTTNKIEVLLDRAVLLYDRCTNEKSESISLDWMVDQLSSMIKFLSRTLYAANSGTRSSGSSPMAAAAAETSDLDAVEQQLMAWQQLLAAATTTTPATSTSATATKLVDNNNNGDLEWSEICRVGWQIQEASAAGVDSATIDALVEDYWKSSRNRVNLINNENNNDEEDAFYDVSNLGTSNVLSPSQANVVVEEMQNAMLLDPSDVDENNDTNNDENKEFVEQAQDYPEERNIVNDNNNNNNNPFRIQTASFGVPMPDFSSLPSIFGGGGGGRGSAEINNNGRPTGMMSFGDTTKEPSPEVRPLPLRPTPPVTPPLPLTWQQQETTVTADADISTTSPPSADDDEPQIEFTLLGGQEKNQPPPMPSSNQNNSENNESSTSMIGNPNWETTTAATATGTTGYIENTSSSFDETSERLQDSDATRYDAGSLDKSDESTKATMFPGTPFTFPSIFGNSGRSTTADPVVEVNKDDFSQHQQQEKSSVSPPFPSMNLFGGGGRTEMEQQQQKSSTLPSVFGGMFSDNRDNNKKNDVDGVREDLTLRQEDEDDSRDANSKNFWGTTNSIAGSTFSSFNIDELTTSVATQEDTMFSNDDIRQDRFDNSDSTTASQGEDFVETRRLNIADIDVLTSEEGQGLPSDAATLAFQDASSSDTPDTTTESTLTTPASSKRSPLASVFSEPSEFIDEQQDDIAGQTDFAEDDGPRLNIADIDFESLDDEEGRGQSDGPSDMLSTPRLKNENADSDAISQDDEADTSQAGFPFPSFLQMMNKKEDAVPPVLGPTEPNMGKPASTKDEPSGFELPSFPSFSNKGDTSVPSDKRASMPEFGQPAFLREDRTDEEASTEAFAPKDRPGFNIPGIPLFSKDRETASVGSKEDQPTGFRNMFGLRSTAQEAPAKAQSKPKKPLSAVEQFRNEVERVGRGEAPTATPISNPFEDLDQASSAKASESSFSQPGDAETAVDEERPATTTVPKIKRQQVFVRPKRAVPTKKDYNLMTKAEQDWARAADRRRRRKAEKAPFLIEKPSNSPQWSVPGRKYDMGPLGSINRRNPEVIQYARRMKEIKMHRKREEKRRALENKVRRNRERKEESRKMRNRSQAERERRRSVEQYLRKKSRIQEDRDNRARQLLRLQDLEAKKDQLDGYLYDIGLNVQGGVKTVENTLLQGANAVENVYEQGVRAMGRSKERVDNFLYETGSSLQQGIKSVEHTLQQGASAVETQYERGAQAMGRLVSNASAKAQAIAEIPAEVEVALEKRREPLPPTPKRTEFYFISELVKTRKLPQAFDKLSTPERIAELVFQAEQLKEIAEPLGDAAINFSRAAASAARPLAEKGMAVMKSTGDRAGEILRSMRQRASESQFATFAPPNLTDELIRLRGDRPALGSRDNFGSEINAESESTPPIAPVPPSEYLFTVENFENNNEASLSSDSTDGLSTDWENTGLQASDAESRRDTGYENLAKEWAALNSDYMTPEAVVTAQSPSDDEIQSNSADAESPEDIYPASNTEEQAEDFQLSTEYLQEETDGLVNQYPDKCEELITSVDFSDLAQAWAARNCDAASPTVSRLDTLGYAAMPSTLRDQTAQQIAAPNAKPSSPETSIHELEDLTREWTEMNRGNEPDSQTPNFSYTNLRAQLETVEGRQNEESDRWEGYPPTTHTSAGARSSTSALAAVLRDTFEESDDPREGDFIRMEEDKTETRPTWQTIAAEWAAVNGADLFY